ncbi:N(6)-adenine-specific methyltransferase METTL4-like [Watersipora subatra]|uniref:N(6)-adenine-specific methyltransferase METTL4-like n=1 Tax=Watersipora subatra TaxID=2589382 RepID=UPI00355C3361
MAVIHETADGFILDTLKFYEDCYGELLDVTSRGLRRQAVRPKSCLYNVESVFKMISEHEADVRETEMEAVALERRRKRKRKKERCSQSEPVDSRIELMFNSIMVSAKAAGLFNHVVSSNDNNVVARSLVDSLGCSSLLVELTGMSCHGAERSIGYVQLNTPEDAASCQESFCHNLIESNCVDNISLRLQGRKFLIPTNSSFLMSDILGLQEFSQTFDRKFNFLIVDPPWENKSARRKKVYKRLNNTEFLELPIKRMSAENSLLLLWCTNCKSQREFIEKSLLPHWDFRVVSTWYWCKVTKSGDLIRPFHKGGKKPYETLCIAVRTGQAIPEQLISQKVIVSIPSLIHSAKPALLELFKKYLPENPKCLELFARNLLPNFMSWGNEVIHQQDMDYFDVG